MELVLMRHSLKIVLTTLSMVALCACHSFAVVPMDLTARSGDQAVQVRIWISDQGLMEGYGCGAQVALAVLLYPLNVVGGVVRGVSAPFDGDYEIECGPVGFVVGTVVPGFTLMPRLMRSDPWRLEVTKEDYDVLSMADYLDVPEAMEILSRSPFVEKEKVLFVEVGGKRFPVQD